MIHIMDKKITVVHTKDFGIVSIPIPKVKDRPVCPGCGEPREIEDMTDGNWKYTGYGFFCTLRCATGFANRQIRKILEDKS